MAAASTGAQKLEEHWLSCEVLSACARAETLSKLVTTFLNLLLRSGSARLLIDDNEVACCQPNCLLTQCP